MSKEIYISSTPHETRLAIVENDDLTEIYYERENEYTLAGSIYNGKVTRVLPGMQSSFVDIGLERDAFLYITDFMEEAGDSAEFDHPEPGSASRRGSHEDHGTSDRGSSDRGRSTGDISSADRDGRSAREESPSISDLASLSQERLAAPATEARNDPPEREGGRRRRGSRDGRSGNRASVDERGGNRDQGAESRSIAPASIEPSFDLPAPVQSGYIEPGTDTSSAELGEGAPGADGSRRWRGRRGRRRGRSSSQREESQALQQPGAEVQTASASSAGSHAGLASAEEVEENFDEEYRQENDIFDLDASAAPLLQAPVANTQEPSHAVASGEHAVHGRANVLNAADAQIQDDRGNRDNRDDRNIRDRNHGDRSDRGGRDRAPRTPRGFAPSRALYGVDTASEPEETPSAASSSEPVILPGESLSKYRKSGDQPGSSATSTEAQSISPPARPSTEFSLTGAWDGGNVLPGETLRPRSSTVANSAPDSSPGAGSRSRTAADRPSDIRDSRARGGRDSRRGREDRPSRDDRSGREERSSREGRSGREARSGSPSHGGTPAGGATAPVPIGTRSGSPSHPASEASSNQGGGPGQGAPAFGDTESLSPTAAPARPASEYEPTDASAAVRFDAPTRSDFRQNAPASEPVAESPETPTASSSFETSFDPDTQPLTSAEDPIQTAPVPTSSQAHHDVFPPEATTEDRSPELHSSAHTTTPQPDTQVSSIDAGGADSHFHGHEFTSVQNTGDMLSEAPAPPLEEIAHPTSPLHHETSVLDAAPDGESSIEMPSGMLEEETVEEEEDFNSTTLHASSIEEMDYEEEETLEGAADLGTMIRELTIDQITRPGEDPEEEDDVLEEEDAIDDHRSGSSENTDETGEEDEEETGDFNENSGPGEYRISAHPTSPEEIHARPSLTNGDAQGSSETSPRDPDRRSSRRDGGGRRDGRRGDRGDRSRDRDRPRSTGGSEERSTSRPGRRDGRHSAQTTNLPAISDLLKPGQELLVQIAKEPIAKKGARITSHIALPGRFLVFMPTVHHTGVSRKIESDSERRRLKEVLLSEKGEASGGFIVRTAAAGASEEELRSDLRFLLNLWTDIKQRSEASKSPALIYHDLNLVERVLRDQVTDNFSAIWVDTETEYERVLRFLQRFQPSLIRRVKLYTKETPLFEQFGITEEINKALRSKVWLKSGGSIVINQTEALVAIDINTGKYVGKTARLEDTIVKTNLDAIPEIVRQIRLRDLGGIIIIDFIDMDERRNRNKVMAALEEELKKDRAPSKVLQFNDFGLVAITRKRVKQSLERTLSSTCNICQGTGMTKSPVTVCNDIYVEVRKMQKHLDRGDVMLRVNPEVVKQLKASGTRWLQEMEEMVGKTILVKSDPSLHPEQFDIH